MGVFVSFKPKEENRKEKELVPFLVAGSGFYRTCRIMHRTVREGRLLCHEDCAACPHLRAGKCAALEELNAGYERELAYYQAEYREKKQKREPLRLVPVPAIVY